MVWMALWCGLVVVALPAGADADVAAGPPADGPAEVSASDLLLQQSLLHSATSLTYAPGSPPARGARILALTQAAAKLNPKDPKLNALLVRVLYEPSGDYARAAEAVRTQLEHDATSAELGLFYLNLGLAARQSVADRIAFLQAASEDAILPAYTRAEALAKMGDLRVQHGDRELAAKAYADALALDERLFSALFGQFALSDRQDVAAHVTGLLGLLHASPTYAGGAIEAGAVLRTQGLAHPAAFFYAYAWRLAARDMETPDETLAIQYFDAMLDAGQYRQAIETMVPVMARTKEPNWEMLCQLMEAYAGINDDQKLADIRGRLLQALSDREQAEGRLRPEMNRQLAWYYLISDALIRDDRRIHTAGAFARKAIEELRDAGADDPTLQLIVAVVQAKDAGKRFLANGITAAEFEKQIADLAALAETDAYAAYFLAEQLFLVADRQAVTMKPAEILSQGMALAKFGRPMRLMRQMADRHSVPVPAPTELAITIGELAEQWIVANQPLVDMALLPGQHIRVTLRPVSQTFEALKPMEIEVRLRNTSEVDIPLGSAGLFNPVVTFRLIAESRGVKVDFDNLPSAILPAPRVLKAGEAVTVTVRIDVGELEEYLHRRPLDTTSFILSGTLDPIQKRRQIVSSLPAVMIDRVTFDRVDILGPSFDRERGDWADQYQKTLQYTIGDFRNGTLEQRMAAARVIGSLLTVVGDTSTRRLAPPKQLAEAVQAPMLLSMFRAILQDPNVPVRQEALAALQFCAVDGQIARQMEPAFTDPSPMVRLRAVEVIGSGRPPNYKTILERFANDKDPMVSMVARAMLEQKPQPRTR